MTGFAAPAGRRVLVIGCGALGSRHVQGVAVLDEVAEIEMVDPRPEALALGRERLEAVTCGRAGIRCRGLTSLDQATRGGDLCVVATLAAQRPELTAQAADKLGYRTFLLEKMVAQSIDEYEFLIDLARRLELKVWVNCTTRGYPFHQRFKQQLDPADPVHLSMIGGNWGLATNGVHAADLFAFYEGASEIQPDCTVVDPVLHPSKRGEHLFDLSGTLHGHTARGGRFTLSFAASHQTPALLSIVTRSRRAVIDHVTRMAVESQAESDWQWRQVPYEDEIFVSHLTRNFARDIFSTGRCQLPTLQECLVAHRFVLGELLPYFNALGGTKSRRCPIT